MKLKVSALLLAMSFVTSVFAADPIDESLYSGFTIENVDGKNIATIEGSSTGDIVVKDRLYTNLTIKRAFKSGVMATWFAPIQLNLNDNRFTHYNLNRLTKDGEKWVVEISRVWTVSANTPYLIVANTDLESMSFINVYLEPTEEKCVSFENKVTGNDFVFDFCGTYKYIEWADNEVGSIYGFAAGDGSTGVAAGQFSRGAPGAKIRPMRAYLKYKGRKSKGAMKAAAGRVAVLDDFEDVELPSTIEVRIVESANATQGFRVGTMDTRTGEVTLDKWVDLRGRSLNRKPDVQGTYYNNGKKVIIK